MIDRIEEYRRDWIAGPYRRIKRRTLKLKKPLRWGGLMLLVLLGLGVSFFSVLNQYRHRLERATYDQVCRIKTELELSAQLRLLRQYYLSNGGLPQDPMGYLKPFLKDNKPFPKGCDFWGRPYRVEQYWDYFGIRSAGPNGKMEDADDLLASAKLKDLNGDR